MKGWERKQVLGAGGEGGGGWAQPGWEQVAHSPLTGQAHTRGCTHTHTQPHFASAPERNSDETTLSDVTECGAWIPFIPQPQGSKRF